MHEPRTIDGCWQIVINKHVTDDLQIFLETIGLEIFPMESGENDLPTYGISFRDPDRNAFRGESYEDLLRIIEKTTDLLLLITGAREQAMAEADASHPHADRRKIGAAAGLTPPTVYAILERNGRPRNRRQAEE